MDQPLIIEFLAPTPFPLPTYNFGGIYVAVIILANISIGASKEKEETNC